MRSPLPRLLPFLPLLTLPLLGSLVAPLAAQAPKPEPPKVAAASDEGQQAIAGFTIEHGLQAQLYAAEPQVANPVAFTVDDQGRLYVCESFRQGRGVTDNRKHDRQWLEADLAAMTVEDRLAYHQRLLGDKVAEYTKHDDRVRVLEDRDGDGQADFDKVFADGFNQVVDGTAAGVLSHRGDVFLTCIPHLWRLRDEDGDAVADRRDSLHYGYGVRVAFRGHDSHGLIVGPDGRLYFSIGDRGYNIRTNDGRHLVDPASGAVFRCELDGSNLEVYARGLRNPQELAFDDHGNLFTGDNNSDSGDKARWVFVVPGGDTGWRMYYQYLGDRGPFNREKIWHPWSKETPAYTVPPITNLADGPSGLVHYPGTGLSEAFRDRFLLCDFRGGPANSGIRSFRVEPDGAFFKVVDQEQPIWRILATDLAFGPDGALYVSDWVDGWEGEGKGRIYRFTDDAAAESAVVREVQRLLGADPSSISASELAGHLSHADRRVRLKAQWELARRGELASLSAVAHDKEQSLLARLHGIWGLGQIGRTDKTPAAWSAVITLLEDDEAEVRAQACKTLADAAGQIETPPNLEALLADPSARVRYFAALTAGALGDTELQLPLLGLLAANADQDPIVRHGGIMGLAGTFNSGQLAELATHPNRSVRLAAVIALRKQSSEQVERFLADGDPEIVLDAARAIHDLPLLAAMPALADLIERVSDSDPLQRRVLNANFRLGGAERAAALARFAAGDHSVERRVDALQMLADWAEPGSRDRVLGAWRPIEPRDSSVAAEALRQQLPALLAGPAEVQDAATKAAARLGVKDIVPSLVQLLADTTATGARRAQALLVLHKLDAPQIDTLMLEALGSDVAQLRAAGRRVMIDRDPERGWDRLTAGAEAETRFERQDALAAAAQAATRKDASPQAKTRAVELLAAQLQRVLEGDVDADTELDIVERARSVGGERIDQLLSLYEAHLPPADDIAGRHRALLTGGVARRGETIFFTRTEVSCVRCHKLGGRGGDVGPDLTTIAKEKDRKYLLESILDPNKAIAKNFESVQLRTDDGVVLSGVLKSETDDVLQLMTAEGRLVTVDKDTIEARKEGRSAMPDDLAKRLTPLELRDLVEYLSTLK